MLLEWALVVVGIGPWTKVLVRNPVATRQELASFAFHTCKTYDLMFASKDLLAHQEDGAEVLTCCRVDDLHVTEQRAKCGDATSRGTNLA